MMKTLGIIFLIYTALLIVIIYVILECCSEVLEEQRFNYETVINNKNEEIRILKQKLEEAKNNEIISKRIAEWNLNMVHECKKKELSNNLAEVDNPKTQI